MRFLKLKIELSRVKQAGCDRVTHASTCQASSRFDLAAAARGKPPPFAARPSPASPRLHLAQLETRAGPESGTAHQPD